MESGFCLSLVGGHCIAQKSVSSFVSNKPLLFGDLLLFDVATRIPLSIHLNQFLRSMWVVMFWGSFPSFVASVHSGSIIPELCPSDRFPEVFVSSLPSTPPVCLLGNRVHEMLLVFLSFFRFLGFTFKTLILCSEPGNLLSLTAFPFLLPV